MEILRTDQNRLKRRLMELCSIAAPSGREKPVQDYIEEFAQARDGIAFRKIGTGAVENLLLTVAGKKTGETLLLSAHLDTVPLPPGTEQIELVEEQGILRSDGDTILGGDDRAGVVLALEMAELALDFPELHSGLELLFTVQEEVGCAGSAALRREDLSSSTGYNLDGESEPGSIIVAAPRKARFSCTVKGLTAHAALAPESGVHALVIAGKILTSLPMGTVDSETTVNVGSIAGGGTTNIVPDAALLIGELRSSDESRFLEIRNEIEEICRNSAASLGGTAAITWEELYAGYKVAESSQTVQRFISACQNCEIEPALLKSRGGGDTNNLNAAGIENVVFGLGMHNIHAPNEYIVLEEFYRAAELLADLVFSFTGT